MKHFSRQRITNIFLFLGIFSCFVTSSFAQVSESIIIGTKYTQFSEVLQEDRTVWIHLPDSYHDKSAEYKSYPVLLLLDGNIHFKSITGLVSYMSSEVYRNMKIPEMIVVGIQNVDRRRDYTPDKVITKRENNSGGGDDFLRYVEEELLPHIDKTYRTEPYRILFGHSLGGLLTAHAYLKDSSVFQAFLAIDPSFGTWDAEIMDKKLDSITEKYSKRYLYLATANWEKRNFRNRDRHVRFFDALNSKFGFSGEYDYFDSENHASVPPIAFIKGITSVFNGYGISYRDIDKVEQLNLHFAQISKRLSWEVKPPQFVVSQIGNQKLRSSSESEKKEALAFFKLNVENYPLSYEAYNSLGEAYLSLGDSKNAIKCFEKSLKIDPENELAKNKLATLK